MVDVLLLEDSEDRFSVRRIVDVGAGEEFVDHIFHFLIGEDLSIGYCRIARHGERERFLDVLTQEGGLLSSRVNHVVDKFDRAKTVEVGRNSTDGKAATAKVGELKAHGQHLVGHLREDDLLGLRELDDFWEKQFL